MSTKQLTPEDLEKMSPQALVEFMTENIPADKLRNCLSKVEEFPTELPSVMVTPSIETEQLPTQNIDTLRDKCKKFPIVVVKIDKVKGQDGDFVHYYKKNKAGVFKLLAVPLDKFDKQNCNVTDDEVTDTDCKQIADWIESKVNNGVLDSTIKTVMEEYVKNNPADFMTKCDNVSKLLISLGITVQSQDSEPELELEPDEFDTMSNEEKLNFLKSNCIYKSGILFGNLVKGDPTKATVYMARKTKDDGYEWQRFKISLDSIKNKWCENVKREQVGTEKYKKFSVGFANTSPEIKTEIQTLVKQLSDEGIEIPYDFLTASGSSSFGSTGFSTVASMSPQMVNNFIKTHLNYADVLQMKTLPTASGSVKCMTLK